MKNRVMHRLAKVLRSTSKTGFAVLKTLNGVHLKVGLVAATIFALAYAVETKTILALEQSQNPFEVTADHEQGM